MIGTLLRNGFRLGITALIFNYFRKRVGRRGLTNGETDAGRRS